MAFISGNDVYTTVNPSAQIIQGGIVTLCQKGGDIGSGSIMQTRNPDVNRVLDSGVVYSILHGRFFPQFLLVTSGNYNYANG